ncbi:MAG: PqiC family protein [Opitutales bacterium]|nr:PqiC family protein [Opitutales bacterium]
MKKPYSLIPLTVLALAGCIMPESNHVEPDFYLLSNTVQDQNQSKINDDHSFYLREIELPEYLKDSRLVVRPTSHTIKFREVDRWGEPLEDGIARVLAMNLQDQFNDSRYSVFPNRRKDGLRWDLAVSFSSFERIVNDRVSVAAKWSARAKSGTTISDSFFFEYALPLPGNESDELKAYNLALYSLSENILEELSTN